MEISELIHVLKNGAVLLYPTDTIWGLGGDSSNSAVIERIFEIKKRPDSKSFVSLVSSMDMLETITPVSKKVKELLSSSNRPTTVIYSDVTTIHPLAKAEDGSAAIRIVKDSFCTQLIEGLGVPLLSTSANISGNAAPNCYSNIAVEIKNAVDYTASHRRDELSDGIASRILKIQDDDIIIIRE